MVETDPEQTKPNNNVFPAPPSETKCNLLHSVLLAFELEQGVYFSHHEKQQQGCFQPTQTKALLESWLFLPVRMGPPQAQQGRGSAFTAVSTTG